MPTVYDNTRPASQGGGYQNWDDLSTWPAELERRRAVAKKQLEDHQRNWNRVRNAAYVAAAVPFAAAAVPIIAGAGGAGAAGGGSAAATGGGAATAGGVGTGVTAPVLGGAGGATGIGAGVTAPVFGGAGAVGGGGAATGIGTAGVTAPVFGGAGATTAGGATTSGVLGNLLRNPNTYRTIGSALSGAAEGAADERNLSNQYQLNRDRARASIYGTEQDALLQSLLLQDKGALDRYQTRQGATSNALGNQSAENIQRAKLGMESGSVRARQSVLGSLMQNLQPSQVQASARVAPHVPTFSGGLTPSMIDPLTRQHGGALMKAALEAQLTGSDVPAATDFMGGVLQAPAEQDFRSGIIKPPELEDYQQAGRGESALSGASTAANIAGNIWDLYNQSRR